MLFRCFVLFLLLKILVCYPQAGLRKMPAQSVDGTSKRLEDNLDTGNVRSGNQTLKSLSSNIPYGTLIRNNKFSINNTNKSFREQKRHPEEQFKIINLSKAPVSKFFPDRRNERPIINYSNVRDWQHNNNRRDDIPIIFPEDGDKKRPIMNFVPKITQGKPKCAQENTFCTSVEGYPTHLVQDLSSRGAFKDFGFFGSDVIPKAVNISQRIDIPEEAQLCISNEEVVFPQVAENKDKQWLYIFNGEGEYKQGVRIERCRVAENSPCGIIDSVPGYKFTCKQKYIYRKLLAIGDAGETYTDAFKLPSCCACYAIKDNQRVRRMFLK